ncbi:unnamed protein product [Moneuplotes crassus]|uniref:Uncharacterized protein n=1 Tax=Euplotes crassus TaxID=5936 RepID=A0AAD1Y6K4_EUPCR|nr:unnamed protein product [Moneuplotes crassus]
MFFVGVGDCGGKVVLSDSNPKSFLLLSSFCASSLRFIGSRSREFSKLQIVTIISCALSIFSQRRLRAPSKIHK